MQIAVELAPSLGLFDACGGFAAGCGGGRGAVLWKWALGEGLGDKAGGLCPWGEGKPRYSCSLLCGCWRRRGLCLPAVLHPSPFPASLRRAPGCPRPPPTRPPPRTCSRRLSGGFGSPTLSSAQQGGSKNPPPGWAPHAHTRGTGSFHVSLIERAQRAAASSPRVQKLGGGIAYCIALRARAAPRCRPPCQGVASYKTKPSLHKTLSVQNKYS